MPRAVILTAISVEYHAVESYLTNIQEEKNLHGKVYKRGKFVGNEHTWDVGIAEIGIGNSGASLETERAIKYFNPDILFFVGIAGGIKDVKIGDVVVATTVYSYESGKVETHLSARPISKQSSYELVEIAKQITNSNDWLKRLSLETVSQPNVYIAPIASGEKVFCSKQSDFYNFLRTSYNDAIAVEMEGFGFLNAVFAYSKIKAVVIRGISDLIEEKNDDSVEAENTRQNKASYHASAFAFEMLAKLSIADKISYSPTFFSYDDAWVGRNILIQQLSKRIHNNCRLLILFGITGIGKTALGERLTVEIIDRFDYDWSHYHQENFDNDQKPSDFASVAIRWLKKWGNPVANEKRQNPQYILEQLITHLCENRYLVQMDSLEFILQGNEEKGWSNFKDEWWLNFFASYLKTSCESCLILTSQDLPRQIEEVGTRYRPFWHSQRLSGLEKSEQIELFEKAELDISSNSKSREYLERIGRAYEGHPLALRVIAGEIKDSTFNRNVLAYWNRHGNEVEEVEKAIAEAKKGVITGKDESALDRYTDMLRIHVRTRLEQTFSRLKVDAKWSYIMLCETSIYRCAVPEEFWLGHLEDFDRDESQQKAALTTLRNRYLVEEIIESSTNQYQVRQHNLIRSVSLSLAKSIEDLLKNESI